MISAKKKSKDRKDESAELVTGGCFQSGQGKLLGGDFRVES